MPLWQGVRGVDGNFGGSGLQPQKGTERMLAWFAKEGMIELRGTPWGTIIEVCHYESQRCAESAPVIS